jgi:hypothetical protein
MMSPGTERSIQRIADLMPQLIRELKRYNDNREAEQKSVAEGGENVAQIIEEFKAFKMGTTKGS